MPNIEKHAPGDFCWIELATTDQAAATAFYSKIFGWTFNDYPIGPGQVYTVFQLDGRDTAAACALRPDQAARGVPPHWNLYVAVVSASLPPTARAAGRTSALPIRPAQDSSIPIFLAGKS